jgi:polysaccharide biosynthesis transport protein
VHDAQTKVDTLRQELKISEVDAMSSSPTPMIDEEIVRRLQGELLTMKTDEVKLETGLAGLEQLSADQLRNSIQTAVGPDVELGGLITEWNTSQQRLIALEKDYATNHPLYLNAQKSTLDLNTKIDARVQGILEGLKVRLKQNKEAVASLQAELEKARTLDLENAAKSRPYYEAKEQLEEFIRFRSVLGMKIASEQTDVVLPKSTMVTIIDGAQPGTKPVKPNKVLSIILGVVIGLVVGVGLAFFIEYLDTSVKTIDDVERTLQAPVLGVIPQNVGLMIDEGIESPHAEAYRVLRTNIMFSRKDDTLNAIAVVSAGAGEGKSTTVFNLATVFAQNGHRVVMIDSDLRRPTLHKMLHITNNLGLTNYLLKQNTLEEVIQTTKIPSLDFMASGKLPSSSLGILSSTQMRQLINDLKQRYDYVFLDSPPIMGVSDASILASEVDMTLQVIQYRRYPQPMNIRAKQMIEKVGGNLIGIVLNNINMSQDENYYYYSGYYHDYYYRSDEAAGGAKPGAGAAAGAGDKPKLDIKQKY